MDKVDENLVLEPGQIIVISNGRYSDYSINGVFKVLKSLSYRDICHLKMNCRYFYGFNSVVEFLLEKKYIFKVKYEELYLGAYGDLCFCLKDKDNEDEI